MKIIIISGMFTYCIVLCSICIRFAYSYVSYRFPTIYTYIFPKSHIPYLVPYIEIV